MEQPSYGPYPEDAIDHTFFFGHCYVCNTFGTPMQPLKRCGGCQLMAFCGRACQKFMWKNHKYLCKKFAVVDGRNVLYTTGSWDEHISDLRNRAAQLPEDLYIEKRDEYICIAENAKILLSNPRVCNKCHESNPHRLTDCKCASVSYCSEKCAKTDKPHKDACRLLAQIAYAYSNRFEGDRNIKIDELMKCVKTVKNALNCVSQLIKIGPKQISLEEVTTLNVHVITSNPMFYYSPWNYFIHQFPNLKELNLVFIMHANAVKSSRDINYNLHFLSTLSCDDCHTKGREITYSVQEKLYHVFFSSQQYKEPDVVIVYGNTCEMSVCDVDDINNKLSYRKMIHSKHTILILTDKTEDMLKHGINVVNAAQPVDQLGPPLKNLLINESSDKIYFTCLKRSSSKSVGEKIIWEQYH